MIKTFFSKDVVERIEKFQELLKKHKIDGALILHPVDLYYFLGMWDLVILWVPSGKKPLLMGRSKMGNGYEGAEMELIDCYYDDDQKIAEYIKNYHFENLKVVGLEMDVLPVNRYRQFKKFFHPSKIEDVSTLIRQIRMIKSSNEISLIRKAAELGDQLFHRIPEYIKSSDTEIDLAIKAEVFYRSQGHPGIIHLRGFNREAFYGHIMGGPSAALPGTSPGPTAGQGLGPFFSQGSGSRKIHPNEPILVDYAASLEGYIADQARIFSVGNISQKFQDAHLVMLEIQDVVTKKGKPGIKAKDLYAIALDIVKKARLLKGFMGYPQPVPFIGHGIGLELDEWPIIGKNSEQILQKGMVIALEPKYIIPGEGVVGIENTYVVTDTGMERLNQFPDQIALVK
jgi:Xaa-Pro aminopeptidase